MTEVASLEEEGMLWVPKAKFDRIVKGIMREGACMILENGEIQMRQEWEVEIEETMGWEAFPFDNQDLQIDITPENSMQVSLQLADCSSKPFGYEIAEEACDEMNSD